VNWIYPLSAILALGIFIYLVIALFDPERFQ
jgi:K+-transporting ATPase KdpF subunit